jgi:hypothetical protein
MVRSKADDQDLVPLSPDEMAQWLESRERSKMLKAQREAEERRAFREAVGKGKMEGDDLDEGNGVRPRNF